MELFVNEEEIVQNAMTHLMPELERLVDTLVVCIFVCTIAYVLREFRKDRREAKLHTQRMKEVTGPVESGNLKLD
ncbi:hypothetical protein BS17DRAFT_781937 [Gyrodon lividus]|nr:hypothetical protein BS17DRAFT_781937 [Gyrodon lividus]